MADEIDVVPIELRRQLQQSSILTCVTVAADEAARRTETDAGSRDRHELAGRRKVVRAVVEGRGTGAVGSRAAIEARNSAGTGAGQDRAAEANRSGGRQ
ncbi:MAG TPA: hypothetical protein VLI90_06450, partial [Tepidisphaeraceae bacterium]|nr:hypothetical protein [Tepidisphaeraceae bacterium]